MKYTFHIVDVFSSTPFGGKHDEARRADADSRTIAYERSNSVVPPWSK